MVKIDILKFNGANLIVAGSKVNVKTFIFYNEMPNQNNLFNMIVSECAAYEIEVIEPNGRRFKTSVQPHTPKKQNGFTVKQCSVYGEVVENIENASIIIERVNLNF